MLLYPHKWVSGAYWHIFAHCKHLPASVVGTHTWTVAPVFPLLWLLWPHLPVLIWVYVCLCLFLSVSVTFPAHNVQTDQKLDSAELTPPPRPNSPLMSPHLNPLDPDFLFGSGPYFTLSLISVPMPTEHCLVLTTFNNGIKKRMHTSVLLAVSWLVSYPHNLCGSFCENLLTSTLINIIKNIISLAEAGENVSLLPILN